ncbi:sodium ion-translocating decarboxylase subunit beta [Oceanirhabdus sp. W0125-5]|uniref:sodium ion-translocating decarboxylase subunit beta n=1 Tax=Oceanirhabdus sp. W0125-5 TaxID=2999116 RepID=UPI0022F2CA0F|nr:sodium ion-translocating decarboxylase subunit beta [Oceanirhabdus sp. W0125-5]WBW97950.1 sodium ion-translocating decarboxylase subunit beta [Oceanirhabdus sp. W0125-5]
MNIIEIITKILEKSGFAQLTFGSVLMICVAFILIYLAIKKGFEPLLLIPIAFGMILVNIPGTGIAQEGGLLYYLGLGVKKGIYPPLIFLGIGVMTDFGPLLANPSSVLLGAAAQFGVFFAFLGALALGPLTEMLPEWLDFLKFSFTAKEAAAIGIIGGADGPTAIFLTNELAPHLLGPIAVAAYSYMALIPMIQPPIMRGLTTKKERTIRMGSLRKVTQKEKIIFPIAVACIVILLLPDVAALIGMLMLGNLFRECGVVGRLADTAQNALINIVTIFLGICVGTKAEASVFLNPKTIGIVILGLLAFTISTISGVLIGKLMCKLTKGKINPLIGAAGVSAVPMAARVAQKVGQEEDPGNFLLMNAMGPNVSGVIGSAVAAGILLALFA